ncbi:MAG TPA: aminotransferase class V-fold PLP-dependent enzyme [Rhodopila sp.]|nr:aminotransferase class V-fold PLP-dependent enzyme [Rhodopila sp.]
MTNRTVYLDANATEPLRPEAREAMIAALDTLGNPASVHSPGRAASRILEDARETIAELFGAKPADVIFTSGGTEADVLAVNALGYERTTIFGATEHDAIRRAPVVGFILPVHSNGVADSAGLEKFLEEEERRCLVCIMLANNETGTINPIDTILPICRRHGARLHIDAVQAAGRIPVRIDQLGANGLAISSHKLGGPAGAGALLLNNVHKFGPPLLRGGGQEGGRRGGTPPVAVIAGFAAAAKAAVAQMDNMKRIAALRDRAEAAAIAAGARVYGHTLERLPNTTCLRMPGVKAAQQLIALDLENIAVSYGAACSSGKSEASHVLQYMMVRWQEAEEAIRVSLPWNTTEADIEAFCEIYPRVMARLRQAATKPASAPKPDLTRLPLAPTDADD